MVEITLPPELDDLEPEDNAAARIRACGVPYPEWGWERLREWRAEGVSPSDLRDWVRAPVPARWGLLLHGSPGLGKTVAACCVVRDAAERRVGSAGAWTVVTSPRVEEAIAAGAFRRRPAPAQFCRWRDLKALLDAAKTGALPWSEEPPLTAEKVLGEIEGRCVVLALDDIDVDAHTPWKEEVLLRLLEIPLRRARLVLTTNLLQDLGRARDRLGERVVDRLMDSSVWAHVRFAGESLRRRRE